LLFNGIRLLGLIAVIMFLSSCGTLLGGKVQYCQKIKPEMDHREIRTWAFAGDVLLAPIALPVDFSTGAIYKPCNKYERKIRSAGHRRHH
jgi:hypothetical protein